MLDAIKASCGRDFPVILRISGSERDPQGNTVEDIRYLVPNIQEKVSCPVDSIAPQYYGVMNGKAVYQQIIDRIGA